VVDQQARRALLEPQRDPVPVQRDPIARPHALPQSGARAVDDEPAGSDRGFHVAARAETRARKNLVKLLGGLCGV